MDAKWSFPFVGTYTVCVCVCLCVCVFDMRNTMTCKQNHRHRIIGRLVHVKKEKVLTADVEADKKYLCVCGLCVYVCMCLL